MIIDKVAATIYAILIPLFVGIQIAIQNLPVHMADSTVRFWFVLKEFFKIMIGG